MFANIFTTLGRVMRYLALLKMHEPLYLTVALPFQTGPHFLQHCLSDLGLFLWLV